WTLEAWVWRNSAEVNGGIVCQRGVGPVGVNYEIGLGDGTVAPVNTPYVKYTSVGDTEIVLADTNGGAIPANQWVHLAGTYHRDNNLLSLFVDSTNVASLANAPESPAMFAGGAIEQRIGLGWNGRVDELRIWNTNRSAQDIRDWVWNTIPPTAPNLVANYRFDDGTSFTTNTAPLTGTSMNNMSTNGLRVEPWTWGQIQDFAAIGDADWWNAWAHAASLCGDVYFSTNGGGVVAGLPVLQVDIFPVDVQPLAWWSVIGQSGSNQHGQARNDLPEGDYTITFTPLQGWVTPTNISVTLSNNLVVYTNATYVTNAGAQIASLRVYLTPSNAVEEGALWWLEGVGGWYTNAHIVDGLYTDVTYTVSFNGTFQWEAPNPTNLMLMGGVTNELTAVFIHRTGMMIYLEPGAARAAGAQWRAPAITGTWFNSGTLLECLPGVYQVEYREISGWTGPRTYGIDVYPQQITQRSDDYYPFTVILGTNFVAAPADIFFNAAQDMYIADSENHRVLRVLNDTNIVNTWGSFGTGNGEFKFPHGVTVDSVNNVYVADTDNHRVQRRLNSTGAWTAWGGTSSGTALGQFNSPLDVLCDTPGNLYVADTDNNRVQMRSTMGAWSLLIASGTGNGQVTEPSGLFIDTAGDLYVSDNPASGQGRIQKFTIAGAYIETVGTW
ncbi:MAG: hypothetical protein EOM20_20720, partial [Spartobacteria bacterium]|nr:hypothetical protein [Spartobacteria bacterium]